MLDMSPVIVPKSDQISADDFIGGPRSYQIEGVQIAPGAEQPVQIKLAGEPRYWRPCKSMARVLVAAWGPDAKQYTGRSVTLYRDPKVKWGGVEVGGVRISHMSHIERPLSMALTATKGRRADYTVKPLSADVTNIREPAPAPEPDAVMSPKAAMDMLASCETLSDLRLAWGQCQATVRANPDYADALNEAKEDRKAELTRAMEAV